jgi:thioredoxin reductase/Pyruvate/2-oxoacid:ferredoxin oxidoreductase delta subunit
MLETIIYLVTALIAVGIPVVYIRHERKKSRDAALILQKAVERGMDEPVSLHPYIDPGICIGSGACVAACPEPNVLGLIQNRGALINPSHCVGHGMCAAACPVDAITLVFGTTQRGVDIPFVSGSFETNIPGMYIAGELGGMGLIRNAIKQGSEAANNIARSLAAEPKRDGLDLLIVGAGPAGIAAALQAKKDGLSFLAIDQDDLGGTILTYPRKKLIMTQPMDLPLYGKITDREIEKEALLKIFLDMFQRTGLKVNGGEKVESVTKQNGRFEVTTARGAYEARRVLLAIGRRGSPRKLDVPGEKSGKVAYRLLEPEHFRAMKILVVGGGDSAVESALALAEQPGNVVHISYRRETFFRLKEGNAQRVQNAIRTGKVTPLFNSEVKHITPNALLLDQGGHPLELPNDYVFVFAGGELPTEFLKKAGIEVTRKFGER